ncbi:uncharacterized protein LOC144111274 isoform X1 [Amblyomma americanum]
MENLTTSTVHSQDRLRHPRPMRRRRRESTHCSSDNTCYCRTCEADAAETDRHFNWVTWCPMYLLLAAPHFLGCLPINDDGRVKESLEHGDDPSETHRRLRTSSNCWHHWSSYQLSMRHQMAQKCSCHWRTACLKEAEETASHKLWPAPHLQCQCCSTCTANHRQPQRRHKQGQCWRKQQCHSRGKQQCRCWHKRQKKGTPKELPQATRICYRAASCPP